MENQHTDDLSRILWTVEEILEIVHFMKDHRSQLEGDPILDFAEVCQLLRQSERQVHRFCEQGLLVGFNIRARRMCLLPGVHGNLLSLDRSRGDGTGSGSGSGSDFSYMYEGNRLVSLVDSGENYSYTYDTNGNLIHNGANNLDITYNDLNQIEKVNRDGAVLANYSYLADGTKFSATDADGNGLYYLGSLVYERSSSGQSLELESLGFDGGRFIKTTSGLEPRYFITDHLGSVRVVVNDQGEVLEQNDYYPFGLRWENAESPITDNRYRYNGKEEQSFVSVPYIDYGARMYDPKYGIRWTGVDPLAEKYLNLSPYAYCMGNPIKFVDPNGLEIKGVTNQDAQNFKNDIYNILAADKFANLRALIDITGRTFKSIDVKVLSSALEDVDLTEDESAYISMMTNAINSKNIYKIEYISGDYTSMEGAQAFVNYMNNTLGNDLGDKMITPDGKLSTAWIRKSGNGLNVPTKRGSHSFIGDNLQKIERAVVSGHEVFGHGIPAARKMTPAANNANAIRTENLIRRILNIPQRDGSDHGGYQQGHITNPYNLPIIQ